MYSKYIPNLVLFGGDDQITCNNQMEELIETQGKIIFYTLHHS